MKIEDLISKLPPMKTGAELTKALEDIPPYSEDVRNADTTTRLMALSELYNVYVPSSMSHEIYSKLYLAMIRSLQKKCSQQAILQRYENNAAIVGQEYRGIIGGADSFTIIGESGIGKSSAISVKCIEDEIPFELPSSWVWTRLGTLSFAIQYGLSNSAEQDGTHRLLRITDIQDGKVNWDSVPFTTVNESENYLLSIGDIVFARTGATVQ